VGMLEPPANQVIALTTALGDATSLHLPLSLIAAPDADAVADPVAAAAPDAAPADPCPCRCHGPCCTAGCSIGHRPLERPTSQRPRREPTPDKGAAQDPY